MKACWRWSAIRPTCSIPPSGSEGEVRARLMEEVGRTRAAACSSPPSPPTSRACRRWARSHKATGRQLCVAGRSLDRIIAAGQIERLSQRPARNLSISTTAMDLPRGEVLILATGGQGEARAALAGSRRATPHPLEEGDVVLFSSRQIPATNWRSAASRTGLREQGHHAGDRPAEPDPRFRPSRTARTGSALWLDRPEILMPVHGEMRHMRRTGAAWGLRAAFPRRSSRKTATGASRARWPRRRYRLDGHSA
jgi:ribonuclease J